MSGFCGSFGPGQEAFDPERMAVAVRRPALPLRVGRCAGGTVALAANAGEGRLFRDDGLLIAVWGGCAATLARQWRTGGAAGCADMGGSFAFALIDEYRGEALLGVDRLASRPLCYRVHGGTLSFATCADALARPGASAAHDPQALFDYLYFQYIPPGASLHPEIARLGPGETLHFARGHALRRRASQPLMIAALADDTTEVLPAAGSLADAVPDMAAALDQPFGKPVLGAAWMAAQRAAARGEAVAFDIVFDSERHARERLRSRYAQLPGPLRQVVIEPVLFHMLGGVHSAGLEEMRGRVAQCVAWLPEALEAGSLLGIYGIDKVVDRDLLAAVDRQRPLKLLRDAWWSTYGEDDARRLAAIDLQFEVAGGALPAMAAACDAFGVALSVPALDNAAPSATLGRAARADSWLERDEHLRALAYDSLLDLKRRRIVRGAFIDMLLSLSAPANADMVWMLMMLEQWFAQRSRAAQGSVAHEQAACCK
ncbi:hypothetical protein [Pseudoduganella sp. GCM10020061]|uniref:hypothetical protein n=1 Tax=Pseudoduganella sp. GCM10020061 TaxID=3317345 RepID=UPI00363A5474